MIGYFVYHANLKIGKVTRADSSTFLVHFFADGSFKLFERSAFSDRELTRSYLPLGTRCHAGNRSCRIDQIAEQIRDRQPVVYLVTTEDGLQLKVDETDLVPAKIIREDPVSSLANLQQEGYPLFATRSELVDALAEVVRQGGGLTALLSSRIDVRPHQAYVAGVVLQDRVRRYILADEVGLGKTIEAGIIIQDLLSTNPAARVLVLCPGALTQQWLCEFYTKFSTRVFTLLDLHPTPEGLSVGRRRTVIAPFHALAGPHRAWLADTRWDLVVIDEVHHLLVADDAYAFAQQLSGRVASVLLLSALPAQQRKTEVLQLLALLEPDRYTSAPSAEFDRLYDAQSEISRHLRRLRRRLEDSSTDPADIEEVVKDLVAHPVLQGDRPLQEQARSLHSAAGILVQAAWGFLRSAADRSRINRRILRNRRERLIEDGLLDRTSRRFLPSAYDPGQPEYDAVRAAGRLVHHLHGTVDPLVWSAFGRVLMQSLAHPETAAELLSRLAAVPQAARDEMPEPLGHLAGTFGWGSYRDWLLRTVRPHLLPADIAECVEAVQLWRDAATGLARVSELIELVERLELTHKKLVVFAGYPGLVEHLLPQLLDVFEPESICEFRAELGQREKEENVQRFRSDPEAWLLLSDESGGEGRNFQFAGAVVHYDTPWYVSRVEQRVGRLDRLGRSVSEVPVSVLFGRGTPEEDLVKCYADGFRVYERSVSGLEFSLRDLELDLVSSLLGPGRKTPDEIVPELRERVEQERVRDENEAVLDEASFNRDAAARYRRSNTLGDAEERLERAFTEFVRKVATWDGARAKHDREFPSGIWEFDPTQFQHLKLELAGQGEKGLPPATVRGTFRRRIAQDRLDLQFLSVGHPYFDAVTKAIHTQQVGRVYAVDVSADDRPPWHGFEFVLVAGPDPEPLHGNSGLLSRAARVFVVPPLHLFVDAQGRVEAHGDDLLKLRRGLGHSDKDRSWWNLTKQKAVRVTLPFGDQDGWRRAVQNAHAVALTEAKRLFAERIGPEVAKAVEVLAEQRRQAEGNDPGEADGLDRLQRAIRGWAVTVEGTGFLSVNGRLGRAK